MSGCGAAEVPDMHLRERVLLAWTPRLQACDETKVQCGRAVCTGARRNGMESSDGVGMRAEEGQA